MEYTHNRFPFQEGRKKARSDNGQVLAGIEWSPCSKMFHFVEVVWKYARPQLGNCHVPGVLIKMNDAAHTLSMASQCLQVKVCIDVFCVCLPFLRLSF